MARNLEQRTLPSGYSNLGAMFPFGVSHIILTDLNDGTKWALTWNSVVVAPDIYGHISITNDLSVARREGFIEYGLNEGPLLFDGSYMLILRGGRLGFVENPFPLWEQMATTPKPYAKFQFEQPRLVYMAFGAVIRLAFTPEFRS